MGEEEEQAGGVQHGDEENEPPNERSAAEEGMRRLDLREPLAESQMTVPETPSPDMAFLKGGGRRHGQNFAGAPACISCNLVSG